MKPIQFADGEVQIDASIVAEGLGIALPRLKEGMRAGTLASTFMIARSSTVHPRSPRRSDGAAER